jgi:hypothetical protein
MVARCAGTVRKERDATIRGMLRPFAVALALLVLVAPAGAATLEELGAALSLAPLHGAAPPPMALERLADSKVVSLAFLRGRPVLVYFWATW